MAKKLFHFPHRHFKGFLYTLFRQRAGVRKLEQNRLTAAKEGLGILGIVLLVQSTSIHLPLRSISAFEEDVQQGHQA